MIINYLRIAFRHHRKHALYTVINITGLATGITCLLLAVLYMKDEHSYDAFHEQAPNLYRITTTVTRQPGDKPQTLGGTGQVQGPAFQAQVPEVQQYVRVMGGDIYGDLAANGKVLKQQLLFVDDNFLDAFSFRLIKGDPRTALNDIGAAVITESTALRYFNSTEVTGRLLTMEADPSARRLGKPLVITAVVKDPPRHSSIRFDVLLSFRFLQLSFDDRDWLNQYLSTFIVLQPGADMNAVARKFDRVSAAAAKAQLAAQGEENGPAPLVHYGLQRITDMHLHPLYQPGDSREGGVINGSNPVFSRILLGIAAFILLMAGINFVNITLAGSLGRTREVGVRKINGSSSRQLMLQFLAESGSLCLAGCLLAILFTWMALPLFNTLSGKEILFSDMLDARLLLYGTPALALIVVLTGAYPAYVLSGYGMIAALYGRQKLVGRNIPGRALIVVQFACAVFLVLATLVFYRQMDYVRTKDLGYEPHQVVHTSITGDRDLQHVQELLKSRLAGRPGIREISFGGIRGGASAVKTGNSTVMAVHRVIDEHYLPALGITLKEGHNLQGGIAGGRNGAIVNEAFVKAAGLRNPVGAQIRTDEYFDREVRTIIGVVKDFHVGSLRERIQPMVMIRSDWFGGDIWLKVEKEKQQQALAALAAAYQEALPGSSFHYSFLDEQNAAAYFQELRWKKIIHMAALLSILICCAGLFGLAHIATRQRIKEIGIRKVLGAGMYSIMALFSKDFLRLVLLGFVIASPVAWRVLNGWLQRFAYRVEINGWIFIIAGAFALGIAFITIAAHVMSAVLTNPSRNLNAE
ncbi:ABC transporter permease [Chitinophaga japonensis]|uniref:FtsX-like permease family protein n=1 Tax=Chitinophaga japonensis TaxID=104662 RepID=A0A562T098_CHIJA|nr:ABC transporter permease [Chitinophaga japonensis]TWI86430.1 FtsX-like permease family protein [Chitinophaga japonensis]